jgi:hypothetical protein
LVNWPDADLARRWHLDHHHIIGLFACATPLVRFGRGMANAWAGF